MKPIPDFQIDINMNRNTSGTFAGLLIIIQALLIVAKIVGAVSWKWVWVLIPTFGFIFIVVVIILLFALAWLIGTIIDYYRNRKKH